MSILKIKNEQGEWVELPVIKGTDGADGKSGVYIGTDEPTDEDIDVWIDSDGTADDIVTDVKVNDVSVVTDGVANIPIASRLNLGAIKVNSDVTESGLSMDSTTGFLEVFGAPTFLIKDGENVHAAITPYQQHTSTFYGLAKAAGHDEKNSSLPVGTYTEEAKASIKNMLGVQDGLVVNAILVSGTQYTIDSTYDDIKTALSAGKTVVVMTGGVPQPYVGNVQLYGEWYLAFGVSTIYDNIATLTGFMIPQTYQNVAIWTQQNTTIPQLNDVQINGQSIVTDGVANVPIASENIAGVIKVSGRTNGLFTSNDTLYIDPALSTDIKNGLNFRKPIAPRQQHESTFYGLAKASGDSTQSQSSNAVGTYTEDAKSKISEMLNGSVSVSSTTPTIVAKSGIRYVCGEVATLDFTPSQTGICDVVFTSGATATVLTVPSTVRWANGFDPTSLDTNATYELNIMDGLGVVMAWT